MKSRASFNKKRKSGTQNFQMHATPPHPGFVELIIGRKGRIRKKILHHKVRHSVAVTKRCPALGLKVKRGRRVRIKSNQANLRKAH